MAALSNPTVRPSRSIQLGRLSTSQLLIALLFVLMFTLATRVPVDTDTWWHLRTGAQIISTHSVPFSEPEDLIRLIGVPRDE